VVGGLVALPEEVWGYCHKCKAGRKLKKGVFGAYRCSTCSGAVVPY